MGKVGKEAVEGSVEDEVKDIILEPGEVLFDTNSPLETAYFILEGSVDLELVLGDKQVKLTIGANHFVGDAAVAVTQKTGAQNEGAQTPPYKGKAIVKESLRAVTIPINDIKNELESCSPLLKAWFASFTSRVLTVMDVLSHD